MSKTRQVEELHGLYGPFTMSERILQQIWLRQDFDCLDLRTASGNSLEILDPGSWNHGGGPDFMGAVLRVAGELRAGDVEVHFYETDWQAHGHDHNSSFNNVMLHVVLYEPRLLSRDTRAVKTEADKPLETFYLMPRLHCDLESYVEVTALREMEAVDHLEWVNAFMAMDSAKRRAILERAGRQRWKQKVGYAKQRLQSAGWREACHACLLEVLGYARNRLPMVRIADRYPLELWESGGVEAEAVYAAEREHWARGGQRPANNPRRRLRDYLGLVQARRNWPEKLRTALQGLPAVAGEGATSIFRRRVGMSSLQEEFHHHLLGKVAGLSRCNTAMVDAFLPLAQAGDLLDSFWYWWHWPAGDRPDRQYQFLKKAGLCNKSNPLCNGWVQGVLQLFIEGGWRGDCIDLPGVCAME
jgi:hypothetical protein